MVWPLEPQRIVRFARDCDTVLVIEEKRPVIEEQLASILYRQPADARPVLIGKEDAAGAKLVPSHGELNPMTVAKIVGGERLKLDRDPRARGRACKARTGRNAFSTAPAARPSSSG